MIILRKTTEERAFAKIKVSKKTSNQEEIRRTLDKTVKDLRQQEALHQTVSQEQKKSS